MATRLARLVVDARQPAVLAGFWSGLLGWEVVPEGEADVEGAVAVRAPEPDGCRLSLVFVPAPGTKAAKNRVHLDLASSTPEQHPSLVDYSVGRGATTVDIGQGVVSWVVLADPEGNEFCVLEHGRSTPTRERWRPSSWTCANRPRSQGSGPRSPAGTWCGAIPGS